MQRHMAGGHDFRTGVFNFIYDDFDQDMDHL